MDESPVTSAATRDAVPRVMAVLAVVLRVSCAVVGGAAALAVVSAPVRPWPAAATVLVLTVWSGLFGWLVLRHGLAGPLVATDLGLSLLACLFIRELVPPEALPGEVSWVAVLASTSLVIVQLAWPPAVSVPAGLAVAIAYWFGARLAGDPAEATAHALTLTVQTVCTAALMLLVRRAGLAADTALSQARQAQARALLAVARRADERRRNRDLHDTALATLTMVGLGAVDPASPVLRRRAAHDLCTLERLATGGAAANPDHPAALHERLAGLARQVAPTLRLATRLAPTEVPARVADAIADSVGEALSNVGRHAGVDRAELTLRGGGGSVLVEVVDRGCGFDPEQVPPQRYGLRESIGGRMASIGGRVEVVSAPGSGTRVTLEWSVVR